jgi:hypothetical protein
MDTLGELSCEYAIEPRAHAIGFLVFRNEPARPGAECPLH